MASGSIADRDLRIIIKAQNLAGPTLKAFRSELTGIALDANKAATALKAMSGATVGGAGANAEIERLKKMNVVLQQTNENLKKGTEERRKANKEQQKFDQAHIANNRVATRSDAERAEASRKYSVIMADHQEKLAKRTTAVTLTEQQRQAHIQSLQMGVRKAQARDAENLAKKQEAIAEKARKANLKTTPSGIWEYERQKALSRVHIEGFKNMAISQAAWFTSFGLFFGAITKVRDAIMSTIDFQTELARAIRVASSDTLNASEIWEQYGDAVNSVMIETGSTIKDTAEVLYQLGSANLSAEEAMAALGPTMNLVIAAEGDMANSTKLVAGVFNILGDSIKPGFDMLSKFKYISDVVTNTYGPHMVELNELVQGYKYVLPVVKSVGLSFHEISEMLGFLNDHMIKSGMAGRYLRQAFVQITGQGAKLMRVFPDLKIDFSKPIKFLDIIAQLHKKFGEAELSGRNLGRFFQAFGTRAAPAVVELVRYWDQFARQLRISRLEIANATVRMADIMKATPTRQIQMLGREFDMLARTVLGPIIMGFMELVKYFNYTVREIIDLDKALGGLITTAVKFSGVILVLLGVMKALVFLMGKGFLGVIIPNFVASLSMGSGAVYKLSTALRALRLVMMTHPILFWGTIIASLFGVFATLRKHIWQTSDEIHASNKSISDNIEQLSAEIDVYQSISDQIGNQTVIRAKEKDLIADITKYFPRMIKGRDEEGNLILRNTNLTRDLIAVKKDLLEVEQKRLALGAEMAVKKDMEDILALTQKTKFIEKGAGLYGGGRVGKIYEGFKKGTEAFETEREKLIPIVDKIMSDMELMSLAGLKIDPETEKALKEVMKYFDIGARSTKKIDENLDDINDKLEEAGQKSRDMWRKMEDARDVMKGELFILVRRATLEKSDLDRLKQKGAYQERIAEAATKYYTTLGSILQKLKEMRNSLAESAREMSKMSLEIESGRVEKALSTIEGTFKSIADYYTDIAKTNPEELKPFFDALGMDIRYLPEDLSWIADEMIRMAKAGTLPGGLPYYLRASVEALAELQGRQDALNSAMKAENLKQYTEIYKEWGVAVGKGLKGADLEKFIPNPEDLERLKGWLKEAYQALTPAEQAKYFDEYKNTFNELRDAMARATEKTVKINVQVNGYPEAIQSLDDLIAKIEQIIKLNPLAFNIKEYSPQPISPTGGGKRKGGMIPGYGGGDIVPTMLEPGEFVIPKEVVSAYGPNYFSRMKGGGVVIPAMKGFEKPEWLPSWLGWLWDMTWGADFDPTMAFAGPMAMESGAIKIGERFLYHPILKDIVRAGSREAMSLSKEAMGVAIRLEKTMSGWLAKAGPQATKGMMANTYQDWKRFIYATLKHEGQLGKGVGFPFAQGGMVPAMVEPGEYVIGKETVKSRGVDFFRRLISGKGPYGEDYRKKMIQLITASGAVDLAGLQQSLSRGDISYSEYRNRREDLGTDLSRRLRDMNIERTRTREDLISGGAMGFAGGGLVRTGSSMQYFGGGTSPSASISSTGGTNITEGFVKGISEAIAKFTLLKKVEKAFQDSSIKEWESWANKLTSIISGFVDKAKSLFAYFANQFTSLFDVIISSILEKSFDEHETWLEDLDKKYRRLFEDINRQYNDSRSDLKTSLKRNEMSYTEYMARVEDLETDKNRKIRDAEIERARETEDQQEKTNQETKDAYAKFLQDLKDTIGQSLSGLFTEKDGGGGPVTPPPPAGGGGGGGESKPPAWVDTLETKLGPIWGSILSASDKVSGIISGSQTIYEDIKRIWTSAETAGDSFWKKIGDSANTFSKVIIGIDFKKTWDDITQLFRTGMFDVGSYFDEASDKMVEFKDFDWGKFLSGAGSIAWDDIIGGISGKIGDITGIDIKKIIDASGIKDVISSIGGENGLFSALKDIWAPTGTTEPTAVGGVVVPAEVQDMSWLDKLKSSIGEFGVILGNFDFVGLAKEAGNQLWEATKKAGALFIDGAKMAGEAFVQVSKVTFDALFGISKLLVQYSQLDNLGQVLNDLPNMLRTGVKTFLENIIQNVPLLVDSVANILGDGTFLRGFFAQITQAASTLAQGASQILTSIINALPAFVEGIIKAAMSFIEAILQALPDIFSSIMTALTGEGGIINTLVVGIQQFIQVLMESLPEIIGSFMNLLTEGVFGDNGIIAGIISIIPDIFDAIIELVPMLLQALIGMFQGLVAWLGDSENGLPKLISVLLEGVGDMITMLIESVPGFIEALISQIPNLINSVITIINTVVDKVIQIIVKIIGAVIKLVFSRDFWVKFVGGLMKALGSAVLNIFKGIGSVVGNTVKSIGSGIKSLFGGGPSKYERHWKNATDNMNDATKQLSDNLNTLRDSLHGVSKEIPAKSPLDNMAEMLRRMTVGLSDTDAIAKGGYNVKKYIDNFTASQRSLTGVLDTGVAKFDALKSSLEKLRDAAKSFSDSITVSMESIKNEFKTNKQLRETYVADVESYRKQLTSGNLVGQGRLDVLAKMKEAVENLYKVNVESIKQQKDANTDVDKVTLDLQKAQAEYDRAQATLLSSGTDDAREARDEAKANLTEARAEYEKTMAFIGEQTKIQNQALADLAWIQGQSNAIQTVTEVQLGLLNANFEQFLNKVEETNRYLETIADQGEIWGQANQNVLIGMATSMTGILDAMNLIGSISGFASGGMVPGYGSGDTVPAMLTPGEYVMRRSSVERIGVGTLDRINYAQGGLVRGVDGGTTVIFQNCNFTGEEVADVVEEKLTRKFDNRQGSYYKRISSIN